MASRKPRKGQMMEVDLSHLAATIAGALPHKPDVARAIREVAGRARAEWVRLAQQELKTTASDYIRGIQEPELTDTRATIALVGKKPNMVEHGMPPMDMKKTHLKGPKVRVAKDGTRSIVVPFRHGTPGTSGRNVGKPMPKPIHQVAKHLGATLSRPGGISKKGGVTVAYGARLHQGMSMPAAARKILSRKERPHHKSSIYQGMIRQEKKYEGATQSSYTTFRVLSEKSDPRSWIHPGITARKLAVKVQKYVQRIQNRIIQESMK